jgi:uncharacterized protein YdeI (YjbR/CyaY-like superfamily)
LDTELEESLKWGIPSYGFGRKNLVGIGAFKNWFCLWFHQGALLSDPQSKLVNAQEGKTQGMRQWRMQSAQEMDAKLIHSYLEESIQHYKEGREVMMVPQTKKEETLSLPCDEWNSFMQKHPDLLSQFGKYMDRQQQDFIDYIREAKRSSTRLSRLEKIKPLLESKLPLARLWS